nr:MbnP family protein [uncultured Flavobacterium sp.]
MKNLTNAIILIASILVMSSCSSSDDQLNNQFGTSAITLKFDQIFNGSDLISGLSYTNQANESLVFDRINYIISNIEFIKDNGDVVRVPKSESYFIVQEQNEQTYNITIRNIPTGSFSKIRFGVGVDEAQFLLGADGQGNFLAYAQSLDMLWSWAAGYKFLAIEGNYTTNTTTQKSFKVHTGKTGLAYNYTEVELQFPELAIVRENFSPSIHIMTDVYSFFNGIRLSDQDQIMGGEKVSTVSNNIPSAFSVHHVHNF